MCSLALELLMIASCVRADKTNYYINSLHFCCLSIVHMWRNPKLARVAMLSYVC